MTNILISDQKLFDEKLQNIIAGGKEHFHVITDFDRTLTKAFPDDKKRISLLAVLEQEGYLGQTYTEQSKENFEKYHPMETDPKLSLEEKKKAMFEWRTCQFSLMLKSGLTKNIIQKAMKSDSVVFRDGHEGFFDVLKDNNIPLLIFSATGLGYEAIYYCLEREDKLYGNIDIISNTFVRDKEDKAIAIKEPIIHTLNKDEMAIKEFPIYNEIKERKNVLLLGDSLGDVGMADGFEYENIIKIGFLNHDTPENRKHFQETFDLVILDDGPMDEVNNLLKKILK